MDGWMDSTYAQKVYVIRGGFNRSTKASSVFDGLSSSASHAI